MTIDIYQNSFCFPDWFNNKEYEALLRRLWGQQYDDLDDVGSLELEEHAINIVVDKIWNDSELDGHKILIYMAKILCCSVRDTILWHDQNDNKAERIIAFLEGHLQNNEIEENKDLLYHDVGKTGSQAKDEAMLVFNNAISSIKKDRCRESICNMIELCIAGYAISPNSNPRIIFNWWLTDIVPSSICLRSPRVFISWTNEVR